MTRDARGRFCTVPDLILDAACREAVRVLRGRWIDDEPLPGYDVAAFYLPPDFDAAVEVLAHATHTAALLGRAS